MCKVINVGYAPDGSDLLRWIDEEGVMWEEYIASIPTGYEIRTRIVTPQEQNLEEIPF